ncbi:outer membrane lipoprotein chaperone LolA [Massilia sp. Dwa41.01b]|uniref:outer membrane lipoprotein chaperone LolA n=1 Tax=unclassified Massilia TaxID=2609279 RepID=UPI0016029CED|nr:MULTISPECIES: outer membrane lipoprotein chaperone LolA [unclassified Massilia]QNA88624.1 outer membrane lipoprotein chaperone LolA [Massilia sp. Dwa41.01b]QNA99514.1 outer membrane lipoprotein chaperone LolA [Massilia sp. Se16.2.3]
MPNTKNTIALLIAAALALSGAAHAAALDQFKSFVAGTKSAKGEFTQQQLKKSANGKATPASSGSFVFARPGKFIWNYQKPYEQVLQADGDQLYIYDKDLNQVTVRKLGNALGSSPAAILFGSNDLEKNFTLSEAGTRDGLEWLNAVPKARDTTFEQISIGMRNGAPEAMELKDTFGQTSVLKFTSFQRNPALGAQQFKFEIPKGAEVSRQ